MNSWEMKQALDKSLREKFRKLDRYTTPVVERETKIDENTSTIARVQQTIGQKLERYYLSKNPELRDQVAHYEAGKYIGMGITEIMREERKAKNLFNEAEEAVDKLLNDQYQGYISRCKVSGLREDMIEGKAKQYIKDFIIGSYATEANDPEAFKAHAEYERLEAEYSRTRREYNAVQVAKQAYIDDPVNKALIDEERKKKAIADLRRSGLLRELDLLEADENEEAEGNE